MAAVTTNPPADPPIIRARGLVKRYGANTVLGGADIDISHGVTGLLGANGTGKTTLIGMVLGLHRPDAASLSVLGLDPVSAGATVRERVGYAPEHHNLPGDLSAYDFVRHVAEIHGLPRKEAINRASDMLWQVGLGEERLRPLGTMSTGQRQRVKLAAAIAHDPSLVLLDEPTDGLDPNQREVMLALIHRIGNEFGIDIVVSSHLLEEVERICSRVVILAAGDVAASGSLEELAGAAAGVQIDLDDRVEEVAALLHQAGVHVEVTGSRIVASSTLLAEPGLYDAARDALAQSGASLRRLGPRRTSLEDVFLEIGRRGAQVGAR